MTIVSAAFLFVLALFGVSIFSKTFSRQGIDLSHMVVLAASVTGFAWSMGWLS